MGTQVTLGSLFSGIGGLDLGLELAGLGPVQWQVEIDPFCRSILERHWPGVPRHSDICAVSGLPYVDVIAGGFPCQGMSSANLKKEGLSNAKSALWGEMRRVIAETRPWAVVIENTSGLISRGLDRVVRDLECLNFTVEATLIGADALGAPFRGDRVLVVAKANGNRKPASAVYAETPQLPSLADFRRHWRNPSPQPIRLDAGAARGVDRRAVRALGNAVVPAMGFVAGRRIIDHAKG